MLVRSARPELLILHPQSSLLGVLFQTLLEMGQAQGQYSSPPGWILSGRPLSAQAGGVLLGQPISDFQAGVQTGNPALLPAILTGNIPPSSALCPGGPRICRVRDGRGMSSSPTPRNAHLGSRGFLVCAFQPRSLILLHLPAYPCFLLSWLSSP